MEYTKNGRPKRPSKLEREYLKKQNEKLLDLFFGPVSEKKEINVSEQKK